MGIAVAPRLPHRVHRMCRVNDGTGTSSGQASTLTSVLLPQARQVAKSERTPRLRMLPSVIGRIGSSERGIGRTLDFKLCKAFQAECLPTFDALIRHIKRLPTAVIDLDGLLKGQVGQAHEPLESERIEAVVADK